MTARHSAAHNGAEMVAKMAAPSTGTAVGAAGSRFGPRLSTARARGDGRKDGNGTRRTRNGPAAAGFGEAGSRARSCFVWWLLAAAVDAAVDGEADD